MIRESENLISIAIDSEVFTGGAHGYRSISYFNFDAHTGGSLEHKDLFTQDFLNYAEKAFRGHPKLTARPIGSQPRAGVRRTGDAARRRRS